MNKVTKNIGIYILIFALVMGFAYFLNFDESEKVEEYTYSQLVSSLSQEMNGKDVIKEINIVGTDVAVTLTKGNTIAKTTFSTNAEIQYLIDNYIGPLSEEGKVSFTSEPKRESLFVQMLPTIIMVVVLIFLFMFMMNQGGGNGKAMQFGRSRAKLQKSDELKKVTFKDVAGLQEEKGELEEIVDFLKNPRKYNEIGARIPKGILLVGPPGTGKTYISKACAGEAGVPFFTISGSDFVEMFVGVGASRVRDLFEQAKKNSPCIVFIDEIDAVGRKRGAGLGGGNDEREQTLNQLLVEMDGFAQNSGIIILAATNRPDVLDPALLRPGRFDRQIVIGRPDIRGREEIFAVHSRNKHLDPDVDLKMLAQRTPGFTPADIENMLYKLSNASEQKKVINDFDKFYKYMRNIGLRYNHSVEVLQVELVPNEENYNSEELNEASDLLQIAIRKNIRAVDIYHKYTATTYMLILLDAGVDNISVVQNRIMFDFESNEIGKRFSLSFTLSENNPRNNAPKHTD